MDRSPTCSWDLSLGLSPTTDGLISFVLREGWGLELEEGGMVGSPFSARPRVAHDARFFRPLSTRPGAFC